MELKKASIQSLIDSPTVSPIASLIVSQIIDSA